MKTTTLKSTTPNIVPRQSNIVPRQSNIVPRRVHAVGSNPLLRVDLTALSPLAREIAECTEIAMNRGWPSPAHERKCYAFDTGVSRRAAERPSAGEESAWGDAAYWDAPYQAELPWPTLRRGETGEAFYERCAWLVEYIRCLFGAGASLAEVRLAVSETSDPRSKDAQFLPPASPAEAAQVALTGPKALQRRKPGPKPKAPSLLKPPRQRLTLDLPPDLYHYIKSLPPGSAERVLREHHAQSMKKDLT